jgi:predicted lysophospholipase L1 biosynthesis ABC-type transport system permease subunit
MGRGERIGVGLFRWALLLLPRWLRERAGAEMEAVFAARHRSARSPLGVAVAWAHELSGVVTAAVRARSGGYLTGGHERHVRKRRHTMDGVVQDYRFALRVMLRRRVTTVLAVLTFGLGIAASTAMFSVVDAVLLRPLPFAAPESIVSVYARNPQFRGHPTLGFAAERGSFSTPEIRTLRENTDVLEGLAILSWGGAINPGIAVIAATPFTEMLADHTSARRYRARLITVFSLLAALFALMGIYGVTNRNVAARTRELGIRLALGAARRRVTGLVIAQALQLAFAGAFAGIVAALIATRGIEAYLWGVAPTDPPTLVAIALALAAAAVLSALAPGLRAARVDPMEALRTE